MSHVLMLGSPIWVPSIRRLANITLSCLVSSFRGIRINLLICMVHVVIYSENLEFSYLNLFNLKKRQLQREVLISVKWL
jgi:hypothetical protein